MHPVRYHLQIVSDGVLFFCVQSLIEVNASILAKTGYILRSEFQSLIEVNARAVALSERAENQLYQSLIEVNARKPNAVIVAYSELYQSLIEVNARFYIVHCCSGADYSINPL